MPTFFCPHVMSWLPEMAWHWKISSAISIVQSHFLYFSVRYAKCSTVVAVVKMKQKLQCLPWQSKHGNMLKIVQLLWTVTEKSKWLNHWLWWLIPIDWLSSIHCTYNTLLWSCNAATVVFNSFQSITGFLSTICGRKVFSEIWACANNFFVMQTVLPHYCTKYHTCPPLVITI